jgi:anaerobic magnesium-protoporphyrin IX monomethyl ester cyclase
VRVLFYYRGIENLGVGYLMSMLKAHGHEIDLIFDPGLDDNLFLKAPHLAWLNRHEALLERAKALRPQLVAIGSLTNLWPFASKMAAKLKEHLGVPIVVGGHHAQALPDYILANPNVDVVCNGEGEIALLELVRRMEAGEDIRTIPGLWVKQDGVVHRNELGPLENELDRLPFPEKQLWWEYGCFKDNLEVFTGRGCPFKCTFCNIHYQRDLFDGKGDFLRKRSVGNVIAELKQNIARYDVHFVSVHDDNFTTDPHWVEEFCEAYQREVNLPWYCFGYPTTIKPKLVKAMKAANCATIFMGVDSGDEGIRRQLMERPMTDELIYRSAQLIKDTGIGLQISCIYGVPGETPEQMSKTLTMVDKINPTQSSAYIFYPFPKTKMYAAAVEMGYLDEAGEEKVRQGISGYHHESILKHPHKELAETLAKVTPIYARTPAALKPAMRWIIEHRMKRLALFLYICLIPLTFPFLGMEGIKVTLRMAWRAVRGQRARAPKARALPATEIA